jgi:hypothetical protein
MQEQWTCYRTTQAHRQSSPEARPRRCKGQQGRGDHHEQQVLDHVDPEQLAGEDFDRTLEGDEDREQAEPEGNGSPPSSRAESNAARPADAPDHVKQRRQLDADQHDRFDWPVGENRPCTRGHLR